MGDSKAQSSGLDTIDEAAKKTANYLYVIEDSTVMGEIDPELYQTIATLRQLINEEFLGKNKIVSSQFIYDILKPYITKANKEARIDEIKKWHTMIRRLAAYVDSPDSLTEYEDRLKALKEE